MKKIIHTFLLSVLIVTPALAQDKNKFKFAFGASMSLPIAQFSKSHLIGFSGDLQGQYGITDRLCAFLNPSYNLFLGNTITSSSGFYTHPDLSSIKTTVGLRYHKHNSFYVNGGLGYTYFLNNNTFDGGFTINPEVGLSVAAERIDLGLNSNVIITNSTALISLGLRMLYYIN